MQRLAQLPLASLAISTLLTACGGAQVVPMPTETLPEGEHFALQLAERADSVRSARVISTVEYFEDGQRARVEEIVLLQSPANARFETISPFDTTLSVVTLRDDALQFYDLGSERFIQGDTSAQNIALFTGIFIGGVDLVQLLLGSAPSAMLPRSIEEAQWSWDSRKGAWRASFEQDNSELNLWFREGSYTLAGAEQTGASGWELRSADFFEVSAEGTTTEVPRRIRFLMPSKELDVSLEIERYDLNPDLPELLFELEVPRGIEIEEI